MKRRLNPRRSPIPPPPPPSRGQLARPDRHRVLVIGAGMSGLACAQELLERGHEVLVLEARSRVGGRLKGGGLEMPTTTSPAAVVCSGNRSNGSSLPHQSTPGSVVDFSADLCTNRIQEVSEQKQRQWIDLGGALIHGIDGNPLTSIVEQVGVSYKAIRDCLLFDGAGWPVDSKQDEKVSAQFNECLEESFRRVSAAVERTGGDAAENHTDNHPGLESATIPSSTSASIDSDAPKASSSDSSSSSASASFGALFQSVCREKGVNRRTPLHSWHKANLEVSCGASFERLGWKWNEDEPYGFDGAHVALPTSWKTVMESMAEGLDILYEAPVRQIHVVYPPVLADSSIEPNRSRGGKKTKSGRDLKNESTLPMQERREQVTKEPGTTTLAFSSSVVSEPLSPTVPPSLIPTRQSRRLRGENANARRSDRSRTAAERYTPGVSASADAARARNKRSHPEDAEETPSPSYWDRRFPDGTGKTVVQVTLRNGNTLEADSVVCTLPLGILKRQDLVRFEPPLPDSKRTAIARLGTGLLNKCVLSFSHVFWQDSDFLGLAEDGNSYLVLNGTAYTGRPVLIFMFGGDRAAEMEGRKDAEIVQDCLRVVERICCRKRGKRAAVVPPVLDYQVTRWGREEYSRMAFTYVPPGVDGQAELRTMGRPVYDPTGRYPVLQFAGEHTTPYHPSTIHGAFLSGIREAYRLDLALEPEHNGHLVFSEDQIYERTFHVRRRSRRGDNNKINGKLLSGTVVSSAMGVGTNGSKSSTAATTTRATAETSSSSTLRHNHRRRGTAGVMRLRRNPKTVLAGKDVTASGSDEDGDDVGDEDKKRSAGTSSAAPDDDGIISSSTRRSQRPLAAVHDGDYYYYYYDTAAAAAAAASRNDDPAKQKQRLDAAEIRALEDRVLVRSVESYGRDFVYIRGTAFPVHGSRRRDKLPRIRQRYQKLVKSATTSTGGARVPPNCILRCQSWAAQTVFPVGTTQQALRTDPCATATNSRSSSSSSSSSSSISSSRSNGGSSSGRAQRQGEKAISKPEATRLRKSSRVVKMPPTFYP